MIKNTYYIGKLTVGKFSTIDLIDERLHNFHLKNDYIESISFDIIIDKNKNNFRTLIINLYFLESTIINFKFLGNNYKLEIYENLYNYLYDLICEIPTNIDFNTI